MTPEQFFTKNLKWITLALLFLLLFKFVQGCNRNMSNDIEQKEYIHTIDSLTLKYNNLEKVSSDTISQLKFELKLQNEKVGQAEKRANAIQSVAEKLKSNTTVNVRGAEIDTQKRK